MPEARTHTTSLRVRFGETDAMDAMRGALLDGAGLFFLAQPLLLLLVFAAVLLPFSVLIFSWALRRTKITGTLTHR